VTYSATRFHLTALTVMHAVSFSVNPLTPTVAIWYSYRASCARPG